MSHRRLLAGVAVFAALGAGATAGAFLGVPGLVSAQTPTPSASSTPAPGPRGFVHRPFGGGFIGGPGASLDVVAKDLNMTVADLKKALMGGQSIAALAKSKNVDVQKIINDLAADATTRIDAAASSGKITADQATEIKANLTARITAFVNGTAGKFGHGFPGPFHGPGDRGKVPTSAATPASI